ncbi:Putative sensory transduction regulator [Jannaschia faecimaris]|uniref:Putative sensory transduction regulator n=1 Tax=Jannaschia faecimaris TaxID=1244108 RepID=A0A1H3LDS6_9RHOB|nr:YbjN domain-containing protein [Jannaschia faecimaris]SDY62309.1 Putative sensory transduction regulator [Jannaschia faecimaris]
MKRIVLAAVLACTAQAAMAQDNVSAADPEGVMRAMQEEGYLTKMGLDDVGDPKISSKVLESNFSVFFYGCNNGTQCTSVQFSSGYDLDIPMNAKRINDWNRENRFARAFVDDEGDPFIRMDVVLAGDGNSVGSFSYNLDFWRLLIEDFEDFIDW